METKTTPSDGRWKGVRPVAAPRNMKLVSRAGAAALAGVTDRTISRWADRGIITKYLDRRGRVRFSSVEAARLRDEPAPAEEDEQDETQPRSPRKRW